MYYTELYNILYHVAKDHSIVITAALVNIVENTVQVKNFQCIASFKKLVYVSHNETAASLSLVYS